MKSAKIIISLIAIFFGGGLIYVNSTLKGEQLIFSASQDNCLIAAQSLSKESVVGKAFMTDQTKEDYLKDNKPGTQNIKDYIDKRYEDGEPFRSILVQAGRGRTTVYCKYQTFIDSAELKLLTINNRKVYKGARVVLFGLDYTVDSKFKTTIREKDYNVFDKVKLMLNYKA